MVDVVTICAVNYLPFAEVLGNSFLDTNSNCSFSIFVIDDYKLTYLKNPRFKYFSPKDLDVQDSIFLNMAFYYDVTELATALKASVLKMMLKLGSSVAVYLDPDVQVFSELRELDDALTSHSIVLTPHTLNPIPRDALRPSEADILGSGTFNLGFIGVKNTQTSIEFLNWWEERLRFDSISEPEKMLFTDQRWIDLVPSYFPNYVLRDSSYNVAYWNLHERKLIKSGPKVLVDGSELRFFHFSGFRPEKPWVLSKYVSDNPRVVISDSEILRELCADYAKLINESTLKYNKSVEYGYSKFDSGKKIPSSLRRLYREDCIKASKDGADFKPPTNWQLWATGKSIESGNLSRILFSLWCSRPDLQRRYPDATGSEANELQKWARTHGVSEGVIDPDLIEVGDLAEDKYPNEISKSKGINIAGYFKGEFGLGQSARLLNQAAIDTGLQLTILVSNRTKSRQFEEFQKSETEKIYPIIIAVVNADHFEFWINDIGPERIKSSTIIGVWAWETEDFPPRMHASFKYVDEIWAVSTFVKRSIQAHTSKPVFVFPSPIATPNIIEPLDRAKFDIPTSKEYNLFIFDYASVFNRKNPLAVVEAHCRAFPMQNGPLLVIKSTNGDQDAENRERLRFECQSRSDILLIEEYLTRNQVTALINECSIYISLHRSEGYGLTMAEAMALGKPVVATGYSGNLDFMDSENSILVPYKKVKIGLGSDPYDPESLWADPDLHFASIQIKRLHEDENLRKTIGDKARQSVLVDFQNVRATEFIKFRVKHHYSKRSIALKKLKKVREIFFQLNIAIRMSAKTLLKSLQSN